MTVSERSLNSIRESCPDLHIQQIRPHRNEGQFNDILIINEKYVFRFPRYESQIPIIFQEVSILRRLLPLLPLPIPQPIYISQNMEQIGAVFMGYPLLPGKPLWADTLQNITNTTHKQKLADQLANFLYTLHHIPVDEWSFPLYAYENQATWQKMYAEIKEFLYPLLPATAHQQINAHFDQFLNSPHAQNINLTLRHGDFGSSNILYDHQKGCISGIIDFDFIGIGDPASDLAGLLNYGQPFFDRLHNNYPDLEQLLPRIHFHKGTFALQEALHGYKNRDQEALADGLAPYLDI
ncbi:MAG TPA: aminoglycoside phosphotransferase family protein [Anaerolineae bacterium]|nr:aminoglycoside phosphotransferase family protein [Anaerolineae bacterium]